MSIVTFDFYCASFEHLSDLHARVSTLDFKAANAPDAARAFMRFYESRQKLFPEIYGALFAVKIYGRSIGEIHESGASLNRNTGNFFEWKIDGGYTYEERVARAERWLEQIQRPGTI